LPLIVPDGCGFRVGGEVREWRVGEAFAFDDTIEHEAWNESSEDRALLILDCWNPHLSADEQRMILNMFAISEAERPDKPMRG
jgi:aspartyl/asparaginyl beta-hydroxylase (cupin superfamily)